jgi:type III restriction enzyme
MPDVQSPIINKPFEEPTQYWDWDEVRVLDKVPGRRKAGYYFRSDGQMDLFSEKNYIPLTLVNLLRDDVKRWRESGYRGATQTTKELFDWWFIRERERQFFFCQREAVETIVYLVEMRFPGRSRATGFSNFKLTDDDLLSLLNGDAPTFHTPSKNALGEVSTDDIVPCLIDPSPSFPLNLTRIGCKMATGSGKTVVMALLLAWAFCNHARNPLSAQFPGAALIVAPNLTVKERLQVLRPDMAGNYFELFGIVPSHLMPALQSGKVLVTNWHKFAPQDGSIEGGKSYKVVDKGDEMPNDFARRVLGDLYDRMPLLVMNDEGHHCWRPAPVYESEIRDAEIKAEREEARMWLEGLDKINNGRTDGKAGVGLCVDLSATPFYISGSGHPEGRPFPWLVSDFGLTDAIESGIVKVPRVPVQDATGAPEPKYFQLWKTIQAQHKAHAGARKMKPEEIYEATEGALLQLAGQWHGTFEEMTHNVGADAIPPVMIVVCNDKKTSQVFFEKISGQREIAAVATVEDVEAEASEENEDAPKTKTKTKTQISYGPGLAGFEEFWNTAAAQRTIRIDTDALEAAENEDGKKQGAAEELRKLIASVGRRGQSGEQVRCVVAVSMLNEGWDSNNVTHILGVRAFTSQLLCEQVVGRGLRRLSYDVDPQTGLLGEEYADVYGIPFSVVPFKGEVVGGPTPKPKVLTGIKALESRSGYELRFPNVEGYAFALSKFALKCDVAAMEPLHLEPHREPSATFIAPTVAEGLGQTPFDFTKHDRERFYQTNHLQTVKFSITAMLLDDLVNPRNETDRKARVLSLQARHQLFPQVFGFVDAYIGTPQRESKVRFNGQHGAEIGLEKYVGRIVGRLRDAINPDESAGEAPLLPLLNRFKPIGTTRDVNFVTSRIVTQTHKSHLSGMVGDTQSWEQAAAFALEESGAVRCYARNDRLGLRIPYEYQGIEHFYEPDFLVEMMNEARIKVLLEIKGMEDDQDRAKHGAANRWLEAVNNWGQLGIWKPQILVCKEPQNLKAMLAQL